MKNRILLLLLILGLHFLATAQEHPLFGKEPPSLSVIKWVQGDPIQEFSKDKIYVVEFSGTWCGPCRKSYPHMAELQKKNKDFEFLIVFNEMNDTLGPQDLSYLNNVKTLLNNMPILKDFTVAVDNPYQHTSKTWQVSAYPTVFVVDTSGKIVWIGNPNSLQPVLEALKEEHFTMDAINKGYLTFRKKLSAINTVDDHRSPTKKLKELDSLGNANPDWMNFIELIKFNVMLSDNPKTGYDYLRSLLNEESQGQNWLSFYFYSRRLPINDRNKDLELKLINLSITEAETEFHKASPLTYKAEYYATWGQYNEGLASYYQAIAILNSEIGGKESQRQHIKDGLLNYQYLVNINSPDAKKDKTEKWLRERLAKGQSYDDRLVNSLVTYAQYKLALELSTGLLSREDDKRTHYYNAKYLATQSDIWSKLKNSQKATTAMQKALAEATAAGYESIIGEYQKKLEVLSQQLEP